MSDTLSELERARFGNPSQEVERWRRVVIKLDQVMPQWRGVSGEAYKWLGDSAVQAIGKLHMLATANKAVKTVYKDYCAKCDGENYQARAWIRVTDQLYEGNSDYMRNLGGIESALREIRRLQLQDRKFKAVYDAMQKVREL